MLSLQTRIDLLSKLGTYIAADGAEWQQAKDGAIQANAWFTPAAVSLAAQNIAAEFLQKDKLMQWVATYKMPEKPKTVGIVMAGNIPLVGFHDFLCGFISGHEVVLKLSSKDDVLMRHIIYKLTRWETEVSLQTAIANMLKGCEAYIATGSNNTARYFEQYFAKYPHLIRKNRTSIAILDGNETPEDLDKLSDDIFTYFGLGCRNITQLCLPKGYDITQLFPYFAKYEKLIDHNKYKNNFDYYLAIYLLNKVHHYTNNSVLLVENELPFSAVSVLHYRYYDNKEELAAQYVLRDDIQCIVGKGFTPFGKSQQPALNDYPDGVDTMQFLCSL
jgi:hypothetical protein